MSISVVRSQEAVTVSGIYIGKTEQFSKENVGAIFVREQARAYIPSGYHHSFINTFRLDETSARQTGYETIGVIWVNNVARISTVFSNEESVILDVYPLENGLFYCKDYTQKDAAKARLKKTYDLMEKEITAFLEHAAQGDTLRQPEHLIDTRYTPQLIRNLSNDHIVYVERTIHGDGVRIKRFLGIRIKEERAGWSETVYESISMSALARNRLEEIFRPGSWSFDVPDANVSAEEWQTWLDVLLNRTVAGSGE
ncbi:MAG: hypothetical protein LBV38_06615 [Alistipes sp.]|nr:hypothetical protein [Alistipes sp.]